MKKCLTNVVLFTECHALSAPEHGIMSLTDNFLVGSTASFECEAVYTIQGQISITCKDDGSWTGDVPVCQRIGGLFSYNFILGVLTEKHCSKSLVSNVVYIPIIALRDATSHDDVTSI